MSDLLVMFILYFSKIEFGNISNIFSSVQCEYQVKRENFPLSFKNWEGGREIEEKVFKNMIRRVLAKADDIPVHENVVNLLYETARVESKAGLYIEQIKGSALGVYQIEEPTYHDLMSWLKYKPERYELVMKFYNKKLSLRDNLRKNLLFQTIICAFHYYRYYKNNIVVLARNKYSRAKMWKDKFNTNVGKGTKQKYMEA